MSCRSQHARSTKQEHNLGLGQDSVRLPQLRSCSRPALVGQGSRRQQLHVPDVSQGQSAHFIYCLYQQPVRCFCLLCLFVKLFVILLVLVSCINSITQLGVPGTRNRGRPRKTWSACVRNDMTICNLDGVNPLDRNSWRTSVRHCQVLPTPESGTTAAP